MASRIELEKAVAPACGGEETTNQRTDAPDFAHSTAAHSPTPPGGETTTTEGDKNKADFFVSRSGQLFRLEERKAAE
jgi:hypothetical protein